MRMSVHTTGRQTAGLENVLQTVPDALVGMDQLGLIQFVNSQTESLFGYQRDQLVGQRIEMLTPRSAWLVHARHPRDYPPDPRTGTRSLDLQLCGRRKEGTEFPINVSLSHLDTGEVLLVITAAAEPRPAVDHARLTAAIVEYSQDAVVARTLAGLITGWNLAAEALFGYSSQEIVGKHINLLIPRDRTLEMISMLSQLSAGRPVNCFQTTRVHKDGTMVAVSLTMSPIYGNGAIAGTCAVYREATPAAWGDGRAQSAQRRPG
jgi:PAS domain S-box-containing protein